MDLVNTVALCAGSSSSDDPLVHDRFWVLEGASVRLAPVCRVRRKMHGHQVLGGDALVSHGRASKIFLRHIRVRGGVSKVLPGHSLLVERACVRLE